MVYVLVEDSAMTRLITGVLAMFPGEVPVRAQMRGADGRMCLKEFRHKVEPTDELLRRLSNIAGDAHVRYDRSR